MNFESVRALLDCKAVAFRRTNDDNEGDRIPLISGSSAELYIAPMFSCVGDLDIMCYGSDILAVPAGTALGYQRSYQPSFTATLLFLKLSIVNSQDMCTW